MIGSCAEAKPGTVGRIPKGELAIRGKLIDQGEASLRAFCHRDCDSPVEVDNRGRHELALIDTPLDG